MTIVEVLETTKSSIVLIMPVVPKGQSIVFLKSSRDFGEPPSEFERTKTIKEDRVELKLIIRIGRIFVGEFATRGNLCRRECFKRSSPDSM